MPGKRTSWLDLIKPGTILRSVPAVLKGITGGAVPLRVTQCITYRCNLNCSYCARHDIGDRELTTKEVKDLMRSFRRAGTRFWSFNGGEALVRQDLGELIAYGRSIGLLMSFATNGTLVSSRIDEIRTATMVSVSVDGAKPVHDGMRSASFDKLIEGLDAMADRNIPFNVFGVVGTHSIDAMGDVLNLAEHYRTAAFFQPVRLQKEDSGRKAETYFPSPGMMKNAMRYLACEKRRGRPVASSYAYLDTIARCWPTGMPDVRCFGGKLFCFITPDGYVTQCCDTLLGASSVQGCNLLEHGIDAFKNIPARRCKTCYSSIPLEANLLLTELRSNPLSAAGSMISGGARSGRGAR